jgi:hypothetical protein
MGKAFYPTGLKFNGELLLYLLTHGFEKFFKEFFKNYTENNPDKLTLKSLMMNKIDEIWFYEDKGKDEYVLSNELRVYLNDKNLVNIGNLDLEEGEKLLEMCKKEPEKILGIQKEKSYYSPRSYYFVVRLLCEIVKSGNKELSDKAKLKIGEIFINNKYLIYNEDVANRYLKELADDESSQFRFKAAFLLAQNINYKHSNKEAERALKYYKIATSKTDNSSIFYMMGLIYQHLEQQEEAKNYFSKSAELDYKLAIKKCQELSISF